MQHLLNLVLFYIPVIMVSLIIGALLLIYRRLRKIVLLIHAFVLCYLTIFFFNEPGWGWGDTAEYIKRETGKKPDIPAYQFAWDNFILIDNSLDKALTNYQEMDAEDNLHEVITDRVKLTHFMELLNRNIGQVDLVVCDIDFNIATIDDSLLSEQLGILARSGKLMLSADADRQWNASLRFPDNLYGSIREKTNDKLFVSHYILQGSSLSLPYMIYKKIDNLPITKTYIGGRLLKEVNANNKMAFVVNPFFPEFRITDETRLIRGKQTYINGLIENESKTLHYFYLGETLAPGMSEIFADNLANRHRAGQKNVVMIGSFSSPDEDVHQTMYGQLHGPVILLNIIYALHLGKHHLEFGFILILFVFYLLISILLTYRGLGLPLFKRDIIKTIRWRSFLKYSDSGNHFFYNVMRILYESVRATLQYLFFNQIHYIVLFMMIIIIKLVTGRLVNVLSLLLYLGIVQSCLYYVKKTFDIQPNQS